MKTIDRSQDASGLRKLVTIVTADDENKDGGFIKRLEGGLIRRPEDIKFDRLIDDCCYDILKENPLDESLLKLVDTLKENSESDYCAIGKVDGDFAEDSTISWKDSKGDKKQWIFSGELKNARRVSLDSPNYSVGKGIMSGDSVSFFSGEEINNDKYLDEFKADLKEIKNTTIIPIWDKDRNCKGFIQLINSKKKLSYFPFGESFLRLILLIHHRDELNDAKLLKKDFEFFAGAQKKLDSVDLLLDDIMRYLSKEFSAGVVSFRIPLLVGTENEPQFFLRDVFISDDIVGFYSRDEYFRDRLVRNADQMGGYDKLLYRNNDSIIIDKAKDSDYYNIIANKNIHFREDTLIIPILRDYSNSGVHSQKKVVIYSNTVANKSNRLVKYLGIFKLRVLKTSDSSDFGQASEWLSDEAKRRLSTLAEHISILLNTFAKRHESQSLDAFQRELRGTSFTRIKEFDEQCSAMINRSIHSKICVIYRYMSSVNELEFSASTLSPEISSKSLLTNPNQAIEYYREEFSLPGFDELIEVLFERKGPIFFISKASSGLNSVMLVPMIRKDNSRLGVVLLVGKENDLKIGNLSKTFCEHDKKSVEFVMEMLTRIEESDSERLTFLSRLSHELLHPVTEMVNRNDYHIKKLERDSRSIPKKTLVFELRRNVDLCMMFKYVIDDAELIHSLSKGDVQYHFDMVDLKGVIKEAKRLFCEKAAAKQINIKFSPKNMPERLCVDKIRMMQVVINLLKNAIQYSNSNEEISISYAYNEKEKCHEIDFCDMGITINPKEKEKLFELFFRSDGALRNRPTGTGIGLYLVKQIMKAHGGDCFVKACGFPTIFTITIPNITDNTN